MTKGDVASVGINVLIQTLQTKYKNIKIFKRKKYFKKLKISFPGLANINVLIQKKKKF